MLRDCINGVSEEFKNTLGMGSRDIELWKEEKKK